MVTYSPSVAAVEWIKVRDTTRSSEDPTIRIGQLPNQLQYYIQRNPLPSGRAELRFVVNVGSVQEDDDQQGVAHFLEHIAFNGTRRFPGTQVTDIVESWGMRFGADLNAYTSFEETVYRLTVPTDQPKFLEQGFAILHEWIAGNIMLDSATVTAERGVVLAELRQRRIPENHATFGLFRALRGASTRYVKRLPIGLETQIAKMTPEPLARFYADWYRPDLAAIVVVGDIDPDVIERYIKTSFGTIPNRSSPRTRIEDPVADPAEPVVFVHRPPGYVSSLTLGWRKPESPISVDEMIRRDIVERLLREELSDVLQRRSKERMRPYRQATTLDRNVGRNMHISGVQIIAHPDSLATGLRAVFIELERIAQHGIPDSVLDRRKKILLQELEYKASENGYDRSATVADQYVAYYLDRKTNSHTAPEIVSGAAFPTPTQRLASARKIVPTITRESIAQVARGWRRTDTRYVFISIGQSHTQHVITRQDIESIVTDVTQMTLMPRDRGTLQSDRASRGDDDVDVTDTLLSASSRSISERHFQKSGITEWTLENGVRVIHREVTDGRNEITVQAYRVGGTSQLPDSLIAGSGRWVADLLTSVYAAVDEEDNVMPGVRSSHGQYPKVDVRLEFLDASITVTDAPQRSERAVRSLFHLLRSPAIDSVSLAIWKEHRYRSQWPSVREQLLRRYTRQHRSTTPPLRMTAEYLDLQHARAVFQTVFGDPSSLVFIIAGPVRVEQVKPLIAQYFAALPTRTNVSQSTAPTHVVVPREGHGFNGSRTSGFTGASADFAGLVTDTSADGYLLERQRVELVGWILQRRLRLLIREQMGGTYGIYSTVGVFETPTPAWRIFVGWESEGKRIVELISAAEHEVEQLLAQGVTAEELALAQSVQWRNLETRLHSNMGWISLIQEAERRGISLDRVGAPYVEQTLDDVHQALRHYLRP